MTSLTARDPPPALPVKLDYIIAKTGPDQGVWVREELIRNHPRAKTVTEMILGRIVTLRYDDPDMKLRFADEEQWKRLIGLVVCELAVLVQV